MKNTCTETKKLILVFDLDNENNLTINEVEGSLKDAQKLAPHGIHSPGEAVSDIRSITPMALMPMKIDGNSACCIQIGNSHWRRFI